jgi:serine/threonine protein kinase
MYCSYCGSANPADGRFCAACGRTLTNSSKGRTALGPLDLAQTELGFLPDTLLMGRYRIRQELGVGGMGRVYLGTDERLNSMPVAIKVLRDLLNRDAASIKRLAREAELSMRLSHPNVIRIHNFEDDGNVRFLVMEYVEGETLRDTIAARDRLDEAETRRIGIEICRGLEHAHEKGVIHRDLKPGNILMGKDGSIKIADFGIARACRDSMSRLTSMQDSGTLLYMSPEQLDGDSSEATDIYSLGCVLYEMLSGDPPFKSGDIVGQIRSRAPKPLVDVSDSMSALVLRCLQKQATDRFSSVRQLLEEIAGTVARRQEEEEAKRALQAAREADEARRREAELRRAEEERKRAEEQTRQAEENARRRHEESQRLDEERRREAKQLKGATPASTPMASPSEISISAPPTTSDARSVSMSYRKMRIWTYGGAFVLALIWSEFLRSVRFSYHYGSDVFFVAGIGWLAGSLAFGPVCDRYGFRRLFLVCSALIATLSLVLISMHGEVPVYLLVSVIWAATGAIFGGLYTLVNDVSPERRASALNLLAAFESCGLLATYAFRGFFRSFAPQTVLIALTVVMLATVPICAVAGFPKAKHPGGIVWRQALRTLGKPLLFVIVLILFLEAGIKSRLPLLLGIELTTILWAGIVAGQLAASRIVRRVPAMLLVTVSALVAAGGAALLVNSGYPSNEVWTAIIGIGLGTIFPASLAQAGGAFSAFSGTAFALIFTMDALAAGNFAPILAGKPWTLIFLAIAILALATHVLLRRRAISLSETPLHGTASDARGGRPGF